MLNTSKSVFLLTFLTFFVSLSSLAQGYTEKEAKEIEGLLMAPCCWGGTVAEHNSPDAIEIKQGIRTMLGEGKTREDIVAFYEKKYGERVLSAPKKSGFNLVAWILPVVIFVFGTGLLLIFMRAMRPARAAPMPSEEIRTEASSGSEDTEDQKYREQIDKELYGS